MAVSERRRTAAEHVTDEALATRAPSSRPSAWWAMVLFITTEATLFAALVASYFYIRFRATPDWPLGEIKLPELRLPLIMTVLLFSSTIPMIVADRAIRRGRVGLCKLGLLVATLLGMGFLGLQVYEYTVKLEEFTVSTNAYGSLFYTITGFHGSHVFVGLMMLIFVQVAAWRGKFDAQHNHRVSIAGMYWHFVDIVWAVILLALYLSPHF